MDVRHALVSGIIMLLIMVSGVQADNLHVEDLPHIKPTLDTDGEIHVHLRIDDTRDGAMCSRPLTRGDDSYSISFTSNHYRDAITGVAAPIKVPCGMSGEGLLKINVPMKTPPGVFDVDIMAKGPQTLTKTDKIHIDPYSNFELNEAEKKGGKVTVRFTNLGSGGNDRFTITIYEGVPGITRNQLPDLYSAGRVHGNNTVLVEKEVKHEELFAGVKSKAVLSAHVFAENSGIDMSMFVSTRNETSLWEQFLAWGGSVQWFSPTTIALLLVASIFVIIFVIVRKLRKRRALRLMSEEMEDAREEYGDSPEPTL